MNPELNQIKRKLLDDLKRFKNRLFPNENTLHNNKQEEIVFEYTDFSAEDLITENKQEEIVFDCPNLSAEDLITEVDEIEFK